MPDDKEMGIWEHINELRQRLMKAVLALVVGAIISFVYAQNL